MTRHVFLSYHVLALPSARRCTRRRRAIRYNIAGSLLHGARCILRSSHSRGRKLVTRASNRGRTEPSRDGSLDAGKSQSGNSFAQDYLLSSGTEMSFSLVPWHYAPTLSLSHHLRGRPQVVPCMRRSITLSHCARGQKAPTLDQNQIRITRMIRCRVV